MKAFQTKLLALSFLVLVLASQGLQAAGLDRFVGTYAGTADYAIDGEQQPRALSTTIEITDDGFNVSWTSVIYKSDGEARENTYSINFVPSHRENIFSSAMKTNVFGKQTPLDPMNGEPFVWARVEGDRFTVFSLFINEEGDYEMQEYHRTLAEGGLDLLFLRLNKGVPQKEITAFLKRVD